MKHTLTLLVWLAFLLVSYLLRDTIGVLELLVYLAIANATGFAMMLSDKRLARSRSRRISEAALFRITAAGGGIGTIAGMFLARHKTRKPAFIFGFPLLTLIDALWLAYLYMPY